jgi:hypothetical protein
MPHDYTIRVHTSARYRGLPITVAGYDLTRLTAVAGYDSPHEIALAVITLDPSTPREPYRIEGDRRPVKTIHDAAQLAAERCEAHDRSQAA